MSDNPKKASPTGRVKIHVPGNLEAVYTNFAMITNSATEIVIDFAQIMPQVPQARVKTRVVMTPTSAKLVQNALAEHLARFEAQYGEINLPEESSLANQLFRFQPPGGQPENG